MINLKLITSIVIVSIFSGCTPKIEYVDRIVYEEQEPYIFQKIDLDGLYIEVKKSDNIIYPENIDIQPIDNNTTLVEKYKISFKPKAVRQICTKTVLDSVTPFKTIIKEHYDYQIDEYNKLQGENDE